MFCAFWLEIYAYLYIRKIYILWKELNSYHSTLKYNFVPSPLSDGVAGLATCCAGGFFKVSSGARTLVGGLNLDPGPAVSCEAETCLRTPFDCEEPALTDPELFWLLLCCAVGSSLIFLAGGSLDASSLTDVGGFLSRGGINFDVRLYILSISVLWSQKEPNENLEEKQRNLSSACFGILM